MISVSAAMSADAVRASPSSPDCSSTFSTCRCRLCVHDRSPASQQQPARARPPGRGALCTNAKTRERGRQGAPVAGFECRAVHHQYSRLTITCAPCAFAHARSSPPTLSSATARPPDSSTQAASSIIAGFGMAGLRRRRPSESAPRAMAAVDNGATSRPRIFKKHS